MAEPAVGARPSAPRGNAERADVARRGFGTDGRGRAPERVAPWSHLLPGVAAAASGGRTAIADAETEYAFTGLAAASHARTASKAGLTVVPASQSVTLPRSATGRNSVGLRLVFLPSVDGGH